MRISDWSSDVCSSDLGLKLTLGGAYTDARYHGGRYPCNPTDLATNSPKCDVNGIESLTGEQAYGTPKIGRASCRERGSVRVDLGGGRIIKQKQKLAVNTT